MRSLEKEIVFESFHEPNANDDLAGGIVTRIATKLKERKRLIWSRDVGWGKTKKTDLHSGEERQEGYAQAALY